MSAYTAGATVYEIGAQVHCDRRTVAQVLKRNGVTIRYQPPTQQIVGEMVHLYASGLSLAAVGQTVAYDPKTVLNHLVQRRVTTRDSHGRERWPTVPPAHTTPTRSSASRPSPIAPRVSIDLMAPLTELEVRTAVHLEVGSNLRGARLVIDEFVIGERGRIDIAVISDDLFGYELKSDLDTLTRLPRQMDVFGGVFQYCTLVVTTRHLPKARQILRRGWGLAVVDRKADENLIYRQIRTPRQIKTVRGLALVELLWRDETLRALDALGLADGYRTKAKHVLWERLATNVDLDDLRKIVTSSLMARQGWRDVRAPHERDERYQRADESSRFLARRRR